MTIGLTGGVACGKSTVAQIFAGLGAETASADADARTVLEAGSPVLASVQAAFPAAFDTDGELVRADLARIIYNDSAARARLEALMHPAIIARMEAVIARARKNPDRALVYETPLLFEAGLECLFDTIIVVAASPDVQVARLQEREKLAGLPALSDEEIVRRLTAQIPLEEKISRADTVIRTDVSIEETQVQAEALWKRLTFPA